VHGPVSCSHLVDCFDLVTLHCHQYRTIVLENKKSFQNSYIITERIVLHKNSMPVKFKSKFKSDNYNFKIMKY